jgi:hypothetical protein
LSDVASNAFFVTTTPIDIAKIQGIAPFPGFFAISDDLFETSYPDFLSCLRANGEKTGDVVANFQSEELRPGASALFRAIFAINITLIVTNGAKLATSSELCAFAVPFSPCREGCDIATHGAVATSFTARLVPRRL